MANVYFGNLRKAVSLPAPKTGLESTAFGRIEKVDLANGGSFVSQSQATHQEYNMAWGATDASLLSPLFEFRRGLHGSGLLYYCDPFVDNALPPHWAEPSLSGEGWPSLLAAGVSPTLERAGESFTNVSTNPGFETSIAGVTPSSASVVVAQSDEWSASGKQSLKTTTTQVQRWGGLSLGHPGATFDVPHLWNVTSRAAFTAQQYTNIWRFNVYNRNFLQDTPGAGTVWLHSVTIGEAEAGTDGKLTGGFIPGTTHVVTLNDPATATVDGTPWASPYIQDYALERGKTYLVSFGVMAATAATIALGGTMGWSGGTVNDATNEGPVGVRSWSLLDVTLDYVYDTTNPLILPVGHSLNGAGNINFEEYPWDSEATAWHNLYASREGATSASITVGGAWTSNFGSSSPKWNTYANVIPDVVTLYTASSDIASGASLATVQASMQGIVDTVRAKWPSAKIALFTEPGRSALDNNAAGRATFDAYNTWVRTQPMDVDYVFDTGPLLSDPLNPYRLDPDIDADGEHYTAAGHERIANYIQPILAPLFPNRGYGVALNVDITPTIQLLNAGDTVTIMVTRHSAVPNGSTGYAPGRIMVTGYDGSTVSLVGISDPPDESGKIRFTVTIPTSIVAAGYGIFVEADEPGVAYLDSVCVVKVPSIDKPYTGPAFDGNTSFVDGSDAAWTGPENASTSTLVVPVDGIPAQAATYTLTSPMTETFPARAAVLLIPPTKTLWAGFSGSAIGEAGVYARTIGVDGSIGPAKRLELLSPTGDTRLNTSFDGATYSAVLFYLDTATTTSASSVTLASNSAIYTDTGTTPILTGSHTPGEGHTGLRFQSDPIRTQIMQRNGKKFITASASFTEIGAWL